MKNIYNKEDFSLSVDVELHESTHHVEDNLDTPLENYILHFPNCKNPHEEVEKLYRTFFSSYIDNHATVDLQEGRTLVAKKARMTELELDIAINTIIQQEFECELELDYNMTMEIITSKSKNELLDMKATKAEFKMIKRNPEDLFDNTLLKNKLFDLPFGGKKNYTTSGTRKHFVFKTEETC